jgi:multidrug resistance efflux pump
MKRMLWILFTMLLATSLSACQEENTATPIIDSATNQSLTIVAEGTLLPVRSTSLAFNASGRVSEVLVAEGDTVDAGQPLARLELTAFEARQAELARARLEVLNAQQAIEALQDNADLALAQATLAVADLEVQVDAARQALDDLNEQDDPDPLLVAQATARLDLLEQQLSDARNIKEALEPDGIDPEQLALAQARLETALAQVAAAEAALQPVELKAPWNGVIATLDLVPGQWVTPGQPVGSLADFLHWVIETGNLTELEVVDLQVGQSAQVSLDAMPDLSIVGEIEYIRLAAEEKRGDITYTVVIRIPQPDAAARWGMTATVRFEK